MRIDDQRRNVSVKYIVLIVACICLIASVFIIKTLLKKNVPADSDIAELPAGAYIPVHPELILDSTVETSRTADEIVDMINDFDAGSIDEAFVYINAGTMAGSYFEITAKDYPEQLQAIVSLVFNDDITYSDALWEYDEELSDYSKHYGYYIAYRDLETAASYTVFVFNAGTTIRFDGLYLEASSPLDDSKLNSVIRTVRDLNKEPVDETHVSNGPGEIPEPTNISTEEYIGNVSVSYIEPMDSLKALCKWSNTIVKARYIDFEKHAEDVNAYCFAVETDFIGNVREDVIHVYDHKTTSYITGKSYYLFLDGSRYATFPHVYYIRSCPDVLIGEVLEDGIPTYTFYGGNDIGLAEETDIPGRIRECIAGGDYLIDELTLRDETYREAYQNADSVLLVTITEKPGEPYNRYVWDCVCKIDEVLKGEFYIQRENTDSLTEDAKIAAGITDTTEMQLTTLCQPNIEIGTQLILLFAYDETTDSYRPYWGPNEKFYADSEAGIYILERARHDEA